MTPAARRRCWLGLWGALLLLGGCGGRADAPPCGCWSGTDPGTPVCGAPLHLEALPGHVVLWAFWGVHCPPCLAHIPLLAATQAAHPQALIVVADHLQDATTPTIAEVWRRHGGGDAVRVVADATVPGVTVTELPRCLVVDRQGRIAYDGAPEGATPVIDRLLGTAPAASPR